MDILVADDNGLVLDTLADLLRYEGHMVTKCRNGVAALALLEVCPFELLITDIRMPGLNGVELTQAVRERVSHDFPVILISGMDDYPGLEAVATHSRTRLIRKPTRTQLLLDAIASLASPTLCAATGVMER